MRLERRYNLYRGCLILSIIIFAFFLSQSFQPQPVTAQTSPTASDVGTRSHICFTATDNYNQTTTSCIYITVVGACTLATADVNIDGRVDILDVASVAYHYGENRTSPQPYNPLDSSIVGIDDISCVASHFDQTDPLPI